MKKVVVILAISLFYSVNLFAAQTDTEYLPAQKYFEVTLNEINSAKTSITMAMYLVSVLPDQPDSQPTQLINALIKAKDRGIKVKVILDQNLAFDSTEEAFSNNKNQEAYELLTKNNVPVFYDTPETYTHSKVIVIDQETVILGSTNWSKSALTRNNESNALIRSKDFARSLLNDLNKITLQENIPAILTPSVSISKEIISNKKILSEMASQSDERAFDTYLYLLKEYDGNKDQTLTLDFDNLAKSLNIHSMSKEDYRRQINKVLDKLKAKYKLIKFKQPDRNQNAEITLNLDPLADKLNIPSDYWRNRWNQTLSFPSKVMYLINLSYTQKSPQGSFSISRENLSKNHGLSESFISQGNQELRKLNLLDIKYSELEDQSFNLRKPSIYTLQDLYNPKDLKKELKSLEQTHGKEKLHRAVKTASLVFEENNPKTIQVLIDLENQYGQETIQEAASKISQKNVDNPKRSAGYLINTIKSMGNQKQ